MTGGNITVCDLCMVQKEKRTHERSYFFYRKFHCTYLIATV